MVYNLLLVLGIRFFLFDFILFKKIREHLQKNSCIFRKLFRCTFCQGFWCGLIVSLAKNNIFPVLPHFEFAFITAIASFTWTVVMYPFIVQYEEKHDLPMT